MIIRNKRIVRYKLHHTKKPNRMTGFEIRIDLEKIVLSIISDCTMLLNFIIN